MVEQLDRMIKLDLARWFMTVRLTSRSLTDAFHCLLLSFKCLSAFLGILAMVNFAENHFDYGWNWVLWAQVC